MFFGTTFVLQLWQTSMFSSVGLSEAKSFLAQNPIYENFLIESPFVKIPTKRGRSCRKIERKNNKTSVQKRYIEGQELPQKRCIGK